MSTIFTTQNTGTVIDARATQRPICSDVWTSTNAITQVNFAEMVKPAYQELGYGAGNTHPTRRPKGPM